MRISIFLRPVIFIIIFESFIIGSSKFALALDNDMKLSEVENIFLEYKKENNIIFEGQNLESYFKNQLMFDNDQRLVRHKNHDEILAYMAEYLHESTKDNNFIGFNSREFSRKTIGDIKNETISDDKRGNVINPNFNYDISKALEYCDKYTFVYNQNYNNYKGNDCTNFVSQVISSAGIPKNMPKITVVTPNLVHNIAYWYSEKLIEQDKSFIKDSVTWVNVTEFNKYWSQRVRREKFLDRDKLEKEARIGDVMQYRHSNTGRLYHTVFISNKKDGSIYVSQHSQDKFNYKWSDYELKNVDFELLKFY